MNNNLTQRLRLGMAMAAASVALLGVPQMALADDDIEGRISAINYDQRSFVVNGVTIHTDRRTDYDDGLRHFGDLRVGQRVEVDYKLRNGRRVAEEIELDD